MNNNRSSLWNNCRVLVVVVKMCNIFRCVVIERILTEDSSEFLLKILNLHESSQRGGGNSSCPVVSHGRSLLFNNPFDRIDVSIAMAADEAVDLITSAGTGCPANPLLYYGRLNHDGGWNSFWRSKKQRSSLTSSRSSRRAHELVDARDGCLGCV